MCKTWKIPGLSKADRGRFRSERKQGNFQTTPPEAQGS